MTPRDCFGVVVRTIGLLVLLLGIYYAITAAYLLIASDYPRPHSPVTTYLFYGALMIAISLYLLRGASHLIRFCYPVPPPSSPLP